MAQVGDDCYFFFQSTCIKGTACPFRHAEAAKGSEIECPLWRQGRCFQPNCPYRHAEVVKNRQMVPCYYESQPGGCTKPHCPFLHTKPNLNAPPGPPPTFSGPPPVRPHVSVSQPLPIPGMGLPPRSQPPPGPAIIPVVSGPPPAIQPVRPQGIPAMGPPPHMWRAPGPGLQGPPLFQRAPPDVRPQMFRPEIGGGRVMMVPTVEPVIVNVNSEESESDGSPVKPVRVVAPSIRKSMSDTTLIHPEAAPGSKREINPLDYYLGAKPWVDPSSTQRDDRRSLSPPGRQMSPIHFQARRNGSASPGRQGSLSPDRRRRRSTSEERHVRPFDRRRSQSLDRSRSQSPDWRDRARGRSPGRPRSRSPVGRRPFRGPAARHSPPRRFGQRFQRPQDRRPRRSPEKEKPPAQPLIIPTGPKIISIKKDKKEEEKKETEEEGEKKEVTEEKKEEESGEVPLTEVRSLEDIYREKALRSLMEAKKKKVIENRRQKLAERAKQAKSEHPDVVKADEDKSDSEKSDKSCGPDKDQSSESESEASEDENEAHSGEEGGAKSEVGGAGEEKVESDIDLADDVDIELEAGDKGSDYNSESEKSEENEHSGSEAQKSDSSENEKVVVDKRNKVAKSSIKSRLDMQPDFKVNKRRGAVQDRLGLNAPKPSIKDRLGKREDANAVSSVRSGVIKLNRSRQRDNIPGSLDDNWTSKIRRTTDYGRDKDIMMVPKIVVRNKLEDFAPEYGHSRESSQSRHGYDDYSDSDGDSDDEIISKLSKRKKKLKKMLESEGSDFDEIELLKREKRKIKKLLKRKKEKKEKRKRERRKRERKVREYSEEEEEEYQEEGEGTTRRIKIQSRLGPVKEDNDLSEEEEELAGEQEEIHLSEDEAVELQEAGQNGEKTGEEKPVTTEPDLEVRERLRQEKAQKLLEALQPKTLDDIRKARAQKKILEPRGVQGAIEKKSEGPGRQIFLAEEKEASPPKQQVRISFNEETKPPVRQRIRLKRDTEQNENKVPASSAVKAIKRERQIYLPPSRKRTDNDSEPAIKKTAISDREIVDYGELLPSSGTETTTAASKPTTIQLKRGERKPPPKVEVENAGIKSFAEIMAEKKRKRLLAQQEGKKPITPIVFEDKPDSGTITSNLTPDLRSRLSPIDNSLSSGTSDSSFKPLKSSSSAKTGVKTDTVGVKTDTSLQSSQPRTSSPVIGVKRTITPTKSVAKELSTQKPNRWKRRKASTENNDENGPSVSSSGESLGSKAAECVSDIRKLEEEIALSPVVDTSAKERRTSTTSEKKNAKGSDSLMDFEDELLADVDLNLDDEKSHDELMREMEELLA